MQDSCKVVLKYLFGYSLSTVLKQLLLDAMVLQ